MHQNAKLPDRLILPIEVAARELDGKLLLAILAAQRGMNVVLGPRHVLDLDDYGPSIYLAKNVRGRRVFESALARGYSLVAIDEEALVRFPDSIQRLRTDSASLQLPRLLFACGADNADYWKRNYPISAEKIVETGNPRLDLLRPEFRTFYSKDVARLRERYGPFVLLNTNFSIVNHFRNGHTSFRSSPEADPAEFERAWRGLKEHKLQLMACFKEAIPSLARALEPTRLVIRPHPSEDPTTWMFASQAENVSVVAEGSAIPWILASQGLIHNGCTTAVEAAILGVPSIAYKPRDSALFDLHLPNLLSIPVRTQTQLIEAVRELKKCSSSPIDKSILSSHVSALEGPLAAERIVRSFSKFASRLSESSPRMRVNFSSL